MKRILLDTNIYEYITRYISQEELRKILNDKKIIIYGIDIVRKELRDIPKRINTSEIKNLRLTLLSLYDLMVGKHQYVITESVKEIADKYFIVYKSLDGKKKKPEIIMDFLIVACASINGLDLVVSEDNKTLLSDKSITAYKSVNSLEKIRTPAFIGFKKFKKFLRGVNFD